MVLIMEVLQSVLIAGMAILSQSSFYFAMSS